MNIKEKNKKRKVWYLEDKLEQIILNSGDDELKTQLTKPFNELINIRHFGQEEKIKFCKYSEMLNAINNLKASIIINFLNLNHSLLEIISGKRSKYLFLILIQTTNLIIILSCILAVFLNNYYLLLIIPFTYISSYFSSYYTKGNPFKFIFNPIFVFLIWLLVANYVTLGASIIMFSYITTYMLFRSARYIYATTLHNAAIESELFFRVLSHSGHISVSYAHGKNSIFDTRHLTLLDIKKDKNIKQ